MNACYTRTRRAMAVVEIAAVTSVVALLLSMGVMVFRSVRSTSRAVQAENNLQQISTALELYFRKYSAYPPQGSNLAEELGPFIDDARVFCRGDTEADGDRHPHGFELQGVF